MKLDDVIACINKYTISNSKDILTKIFNQRCDPPGGDCIRGVDDKKIQEHMDTSTQLYKDFINIINTQTLEEQPLGDILSSGAFGNIYNSSNDGFVIKVIKHPDIIPLDIILFDIIISIIISKEIPDFTPKIESLYKISDIPYILFTKFDTTGKSILMEYKNDYKNSLNVLAQLCSILLIADDKIGFRHGDLSFANFMLKKECNTKTYNIKDNQITILPINNQIVQLIDFGNSCIKLNNEKYIRNQGFYNVTHCKNSYDMLFLCLSILGHHSQEPIFNLNLIKLIIMLFNKFIQTNKLNSLKISYETGLYTIRTNKDDNFNHIIKELINNINKKNISEQNNPFVLKNFLQHLINQGANCINLKYKYQVDPINLENFKLNLLDKPQQINLWNIDRNLDPRLGHSAPPTAAATIPPTAAATVPPTAAATIPPTAAAILPPIAEDSMDQGTAAVSMDQGTAEVSMDQEEQQEQPEGNRKRPNRSEDENTNPNQPPQKKYIFKSSGGNKNINKKLKKSLRRKSRKQRKSKKLSKRRKSKK